MFCFFVSKAYSEMPTTVGVWHLSLRESSAGADRGTKRSKQHNPWSALGDLQEELCRTKGTNQHLTISGPGEGPSETKAHKGHH